MIQLDADLDGVLAQISENGNGGLVYTGKDLMVVIRHDGFDWPVVVPFGFAWDGASIPGFARAIVGSPLDRRYRVASMVHDRCYEARVNRQATDYAFHDLLKQSGVPHWKAWVMFSAVRIGGHVYTAAHTSRFWAGVKRLLESLS
jgi:hypothetical protein